MTLTHQWIGRAFAVGASVFVVTVVACGGSTSTAIGNPDGGTSSSSGSTSSSTSSSGSSGSACNNVPCPDIGCGIGSVSVIREGECCPTCQPIKDQCEGKTNSCANKKGCAAGYERFEYAPGCCDCRLNQCKEISCAPLVPCGLGEHVDLSGCCAACVKDGGACKNDASPCSTFQCPQGYKATSLGSSDGPGCCSSCEIDPSFCANERTAFQTWLNTELAKSESVKCLTTQDCALVTLTNSCAPDCGHAVAKKAQQQVQMSVAQYAQQHCSQCPPEVANCPAVVLTAKCGLDLKCVLSPGG